MRKKLKRLVAASVVVAALAAPALYAYADTSDSHPSTTGQGMMGNGGMMGHGSGGMMGDGSMMVMMDMMGQMGEMAQNCNAMMTSMMTNRGMAPNEQWQHHGPKTPEDRHQGS